MRLQILTPEAIQLKAEQVTAVRAMLTDGPITILPGHAPLIGNLCASVLSYTDGTGTHQVETDQGILRVQREGVTILTGSLQPKRAKESGAEQRTREP